MPEPVPAIVLTNLRRHLQHAERRGEKINPRVLLDIIDGRKA